MGPQQFQPHPDIPLSMLVPTETPRFILPAGADVFCLSGDRHQILEQGRPYFLGLTERPILFRSLNGSLTLIVRELPLLVAGRSGSSFQPLDAPQSRRAAPEPPVFLRHCLAYLRAHHGALTVADLEAYSGYSRRWLQSAFRRHLGLGVKAIADLLRFRHLYHGNHDDHEFYDQSHLIKVFKRYRGLPPSRVRSRRDIVPVTTSDFYYMVYDRQSTFGYNSVIRLLGKGLL